MHRSHLFAMPLLLALSTSGLACGGTVVFEGTPADLKANAAVRKEWLEV